MERLDSGVPGCFVSSVLESHDNIVVDEELVYARIEHILQLHLVATANLSDLGPKLRQMSRAGVAQDRDDSMSWSELARHLDRRNACIHLIISKIFLVSQE